MGFDDAVYECGICGQEYVDPSLQDSCGGDLSRENILTRGQVFTPAEDDLSELAHKIYFVVKEHLGAPPRRGSHEEVYSFDVFPERIFKGKVVIGDVSLDGKLLNEIRTVQVFSDPNDERFGSVRSSEIEGHEPLPLLVGRDLADAFKRNPGFEEFYKSNYLDYLID